MRFLARLIRWWVKLSKASAKRLAIRKWPIKELSIKPKAQTKETWGNAKDAANQVRESQKEAAEQKADNVRHNISQSVDHAKEKVKTKIDEFEDRHSG